MRENQLNLLTAVLPTHRCAWRVGIWEMSGNGSDETAFDSILRVEYSALVIPVVETPVWAG
jgi:hypothetical protein